MRFLRKYTATPNRLIRDTTMHYTSKIVYLALALQERKSGLVKVTVAELTALCRLSEETVLQALSELELGGFLKKKRSWRWSKSLNCPIYAANTYKLTKAGNEGYTLISAAVMDVDATPAGFCVLLFLYCCAGRSGRAFPSIRYIAGTWRDKVCNGLDMARSTVQRVLKQLEKLQAFVKHNCLAKAGDLRCNSYYLTEMVPAAVSGSQPVQECFLGGVPIFREASPIKKITGVLYFEGRIKGVPEFGEIYKNSLCLPRERLSCCPSLKDIDGESLPF
ncbi:MAG TPA: hypothetical protein IAC31_00780 [Candidatus Faecousia intestinigallinarum]|nr:hypothetical protein [Candidatus Faecousia intestinigallinarum]